MAAVPILVEILHNMNTPVPPMKGMNCHLLILVTSCQDTTPPTGFTVPLLFPPHRQDDHVGAAGVEVAAARARCPHRQYKPCQPSGLRHDPAPAADDAAG